MDERMQSAKLSALWLLHGRACAKLLRAHGEDKHAINFDAALDQIMQILAADVGKRQLVEAMDWATEELWDCGPAEHVGSIRH